MQGETDIAKYFIFAERKLNNNRLKYITYESEDLNKTNIRNRAAVCHDRFAGRSIGKEHLRYVCRHKEHIGR